MNAIKIEFVVGVVRNVNILKKMKSVPITRSSSAWFLIFF